MTPSPSENMALYTDLQPEWTASMSAYEWSYSLEQLFKFDTKFGDEPANMSYREGNVLYAPREITPLGKKDYRIEYPPVAINCNFKPRNEEQATLPFQSVELVKSGQNHIFNAPTGWGKSVAGGVIACLMGQPTMIVVNKQDLMDSWYDALVNVLGIPPSMVGKVQQNTCQWQGKRIVIGMAHSLCKEDRYDPMMYKYFGLLIVDEVHQMAPDFFSKVFRMFPAKYRLGFSATTDRKDGMWRVLQANIGPVMVRGTIMPMTPKILVKQTGWKIPRTTRWENGQKIEEPIPYAPGKMGLVTKVMCGNNHRNMQIVEFVERAYMKGRRTLVLSDLIDGHLKPLFNLLTSCGIPGEQIGYYIGGMSKHEREVSANSHVILGTYAMVMTGTNVPAWDCLVFGTPRSDIRQALGRILRFMEGKNEPVALDLVDADKIFQNYSLARLTQYHGVGAKVVRMT